MTRNKSKAHITLTERMRLIVATCAWISRSPANWKTGEYTQAVIDLQREVALCPPISKSNDENYTTKLWSRNRRRVRQLLMSCNPVGFLAWTNIATSMTFGQTSFIRAEFHALRHSGQWMSRWKPALKENRAGLPMPSITCPASSGTLIHHAYHLYRFECVTGQAITSSSEIVEFGGGYGSMARLVFRLGFRGQYHIHDLPEFSELQRFYLRSVGKETGDIEHARALERITFSSASEHACPSTDLQDKAIFLATWSLSEVPVSLRNEWLAILTHFRYFLFGFKDEFEDIDNHTWFKEFATTRPDVKWYFESPEHRGNGLRYLFGVPTEIDNAGDRDPGTKPK